MVVEKDGEVLIETGRVIDSYDGQPFVTMPFSTTFKISLAVACLTGNAFGQLWTDPKDSKLPPD